MACDPQAITTAVKCVAQLSPRQLLASWALSVCGGGPAPTEGGILTDPDGNPILTDEDGNIILPD